MEEKIQYLESRIEALTAALKQRDEQLNALLTTITLLNARND